MKSTLTLRKWLAVSLALTVLLAPVQLVVADGIQRINMLISQVFVLASLMFFAHTKLLNAEETTFFAHAVLLALHSVDLAYRTDAISLISITVISLIHSFLPCPKVEMDLVVACSLQISVLMFNPDCNVEAVMASAIPSILNTVWSHWIRSSVRFYVPEKFMYAQLSFCIRIVCLLATCGFLIPVMGLNGVKCGSFLVVVILMEHKVFVPYLLPILGETRAFELGFLIAVSCCYLLHIGILPAHSMTIRTGCIFQALKTFPSIKLAIHKPHIMSVVIFFVGDYFEIISSTIMHKDIKYTNTDILLWMLLHFAAFGAMTILLSIHELYEENKQLKDTNEQLAIHCSLPVRNVNSPGSSIHSGDEFDTHPSPIPVRRDALERDELLNRLTTKMTRISSKLDRLMTGEAVSSASSDTTQSSHGIRKLRMEHDALKTQLSNLIRVISDQEISVAEALSELQRQTGVEQTVAVGVRVSAVRERHALVV